MNKKLTINFNDISLEVEGIYVPEEPMVMYDSQGDGNPGMPEQFEINNVTFNNIDITHLLEEIDAATWAKDKRDVWEVIEFKCLEEINKGND